MTRVLLVLPEPPLPFGGAAARWFHVALDELARLGVEVTALCCSGGEVADREATELHGGSATLRFFEPGGRPTLGKLASLARPYSYPYSATMGAAVDRLLRERWDRVRFETHFSAWLVDRPPVEAELNVHQLYAVDCRDDKPRTFGGRVLRERVLRCERSLLRRFARVSALTERLANEVRRLHPSADVRVTPMTVDPSLYAFEAPGAPRTPATIGLVGTFRWGPTLSAAVTLLENVWPKVRERLPGTRLLLVGRGADGALAGRELPEGVEVASDVADSLPYFRRLDAMVYLPGVGSGMKVKVLEAIALGVPVVTNADGAEGLPTSVADAITVPCVDTAVERVVELLTNDRAPDTQTLRDELFTTLSPAACVGGILGDTASKEPKTGFAKSSP